MCLFDAKRKQTSLEIVVISTIAEGVIVCSGCGSVAVMVSSGEVTPSIIGIGNQFCTIFIVDRHNVTLQVLLKPEDIENFGGIGLVAILHTNRRTLGIVDIQHKMLT